MRTMLTFANFARCAATLSFAFFAAACWVESDHTSGGGTVTQTGGGTGNDPGAPSSAPPPTGTAAQPVTVVIDTDKTMNAAPGDGVGIFVEYGAGGHWHVWWTCDTNRTSLACSFDVDVTADAGGAPANLASSNTSSVSPYGSSVNAKSTTTTDLARLDFDTDPGTTITISATVGGLTDAAFFFFVQDGKVNGGYGGALTNPLKFEPTRP